MSDTTTSTSSETSDEVETVIDILNTALDGYSVDAVIRGCTAFTRLVIDDLGERDHRQKAWEAVEEELFPEDVSVPS